MIKKKGVILFKHIICIVLGLTVIIPFYMVVINSFKGQQEAARMNLDLPEIWHFETYLEVIEQADLIQGFLNSFSYALIATAVGVLGSGMAAFVMSRNKTKSNVFLYYFVICGLFFPTNYVTLVKVLQTFNLTNTKLGIILAFTSHMIPFCIFTMRNFVASVPTELDEAAVMDGCGPVMLFFKVIVPMLKPVLATCFVLQFMGVWNDFMTPLYLSNSSKLFPMTMAVYQFFGKNTNYWNYIFADIVLTSIPVGVVYLLGQKYIIGGITAGGVKE